MTSLRSTTTDVLATPLTNAVWMLVDGSATAAPSDACIVDDDVLPGGYGLYV
jgi:hypothetical protein